MTEEADPVVGEADEAGEEVEVDAAANGGRSDAYDKFDEGGVVTAGLPVAPPDKQPMDCLIRRSSSGMPRRWSSLAIAAPATRG